MIWMLRSVLLALSVGVACSRSIIFDRKEARLTLPLSAYEAEVQQRCPCKDPSLCLPLQLNQKETKSTKKKEVYAFSITKDDGWKFYDYNIVTTIAWNTNKDLLCHAHSKGVKIAVKHNFDDTPQLCSKEARKQWINETYHMIVDNFADGVNVDNEKPMFGETAVCQTKLVQELREELQQHALTRNAQISFDVSWAPRGVDGRYYQWKELSLAADFLFVMSYDMRSQLYSHCLAGANSPIHQVRQGLDEFLLAYNIPPSKLVLGLPWYGYKYPCTVTNSIQDPWFLCTIDAVPFVGAPCSDAAGTQVDFGDIQRLAAAGSGSESESQAKSEDPTTRSYVVDVTRHWDNVTQSPFLVVRNGSRSQRNDTLNQVFEFWFDDVASLTRKYALAKDLKLLGVGMWNADSLDYRGNPNESQEVWKTLRAGF